MTLTGQIHSYSFYCGHLSECSKKLKSLDKNNLTAEPQDDTDLRELLAYEITSPSGKVTYPQNLTVDNFIDYMLCPTLCYELSYPRMKASGIRWGKLAEKAAAVFGCVFLLTMISEEFILPVVCGKLPDAVFKLNVILDERCTGTIGRRTFPFRSSVNDA